MITNALAEKDILVIPDGRIFALVVPKSWEKTVHPMASQIHNSTISSTNRMVKYNEFDLHSATIPEVLKVYAEQNARQAPKSILSRRRIFPTPKSVSSPTIPPPVRKPCMLCARCCSGTNVKINFISRDLIRARTHPAQIKKRGGQCG